MLITHGLYYSAQTAMTKYHKLGGLTNRNLFSQFMSEVLADSISGEGSLLLQVAAFSPVSSQGLSPVWHVGERESELIRTPILLQQGQPL